MARIMQRNSVSNIIRLMLPAPDLQFDTDGLMVAAIAGQNVYAYSFWSSGAETIATIGAYVTPTAGKCRFKLAGASFYGFEASLYELQLDNAVFANAGYGVDIFVTNGAWDSHYQIQFQEPIVSSPVAGNAPERIEETTIRTFSGETYTAQVSGLDADGEVIDWTALGALEFVVEDERKTDVLLINNASITKASTYFQVTIPASINVANQRYKWAIRQVTNDIVMLYGNLIVAYAAEAAPTE